MDHRLEIPETRLRDAAEPLPGGLRARLKELADSLEAVAIGYYEAGYSLRQENDTRTSGPDWTKQVYFVDGWSRVPATSGENELRGFPAVIRVDGNEYLCDVIDDRRRSLIIDAADAFAFVDGSAPRASRAVAAVAVGATHKTRLRTLLLFYFDRVPDCPLPTRREDFSGDGLRKGIDELRATIDADAASEWFDILAAFQGAITRDSARDIAFRTTIDAAIERLGQQLRCPDIRVYLLADPAELSRATDETVTDDSRPRFRLVSHRGQDIPDVMVTGGLGGPLQWVLKNGTRLAMHNRAELPKDWVTMQSLYPGMVSIDVIGQDVDGNDLPWLLPTGPDETCLSLLVHPISVAGQTIGAFLCSGRLGPGFVFRERDDAGVGLIAEILGNHWFNREQQSVASRDRTLLQRASEALADFSLWVSGRLRVRADRLRDDEFYDRALLAVDAIVGEQEPFSSIRIFDPK